MAKTADRAADFYTIMELGPRQHQTKEGFLVCEDVPAARTGGMIYSADQVPITPDRDGLCLVERDADEVFRDETLKSMVGKPVVDEHPAEGVTPENSRILTRGVMLNPHRGEGDQEDLLLVDLLITDRDTIQAIRDGKREVSLGYEADYDEISVGVGRQRNIIVNHIALVQKGRCGPRCAIGDEAHTEDREIIMAPRSTALDKFLATVRGLVPSKDIKVFDAAAETVKEEEKAKDDGAPGQGAVTINLNGGGISGQLDSKAKDEGSGQDPMTALTTRMDAMEKMCKTMGDTVAEFIKGKGANDESEKEKEKEKTGDESEAEKEKEKAKDAETEAEKEKKETDAAMEREGVEQKDRKTGDSAVLADPFRATAAIAEIIMPGISIPTYDRALPAKKTLDAICGMRRKTLEAAYSDNAKQTIIKDALGGREMNLARMTCDAVAVLFTGVGNTMRARNNDNHRANEFLLPGSAGVMGGVKTPADIQKRNQEFYAKHKATA